MEYQADVPDPIEILVPESIPETVMILEVTTVLNDTPVLSSNESASGIVSAMVVTVNAPVTPPMVSTADTEEEQLEEDNSHTVTVSPL